MNRNFVSSDFVVSQVQQSDAKFNLPADSVQSAQLHPTVRAALIPTGTVFPHAGFTAPTGFLVADGSAISRTTYPELFAAITIQQNGVLTNGSPVVTGLADTSQFYVGMPVSGPGIGTSNILSVDSSTQVTLTSNATSTGTALIAFQPHGFGDGVTTFNIPDHRGRTVIGAGTGSGLTQRFLGIPLGEETHFLTWDESGIQNHAHGYSDGGHVHTSTERNNPNDSNIGGGGNQGFHGGTTGLSGTGISIAGSGNYNAINPHNNMQPSIVQNYIIKY